MHLLFTYLFTLLVLRFTYKNYVRFVRSRQLFSLELVHSIAGRTVLVDELPSHLRGERALAEYFEALGLAVESVSVVREVGPLKTLIDERTRALLALEAAWVDYVGNPSTVEDAQPLDGDGDGASSGFAHSGTLEAARPRVVVPHRTRPTMRPRWFGPTVDALDYLDERFRAADELVRRKRRTGRFRATHVAFVTFEKMSDAVRSVSLPCPAAYSLMCPPLAANCGADCALAVACLRAHTPRARAARHCMDEHDALALIRAHARVARARLHLRSFLQLDFPDHRSGQSAQLQRDTEGLACPRTPHRCECEGASDRAELAPIRRDGLFERDAAVLTRRWL